MRNILHGGAATALLIVGCYLIWDFPYARPAVLTISVLCFLSLFLTPRAWLFFLPALLPVYDLGLYSGRIFLTEFDILILFSLAALHYRRAYRPRPAGGGIGGTDILASLMLLSALISLLLYFPYGAEPDINSFSQYKSPFNGLRVFKGALWIWLFWPFLKQLQQEDPALTRRYVTGGVLTGLLLMGIGVLWERGVFNDIVLGRDAYSVIRTLLDFSGSYRITGLFSSMHVGGTALDGYLVMALPFGFAAFLAPQSFRTRLFSLLCLALGSYAIMVTFSRGLYMGFFVVLCVLAFCYLVVQRHYKEFGIRHILLTLLAFLGGSLYMFILFRFGGYQVMLAAILTIGGAMLTARLFKGSPYHLDRLLLGGALLMAYVSYDGLMESRWSANGRGFSLVLAVLSCAFLALLTFVLTPAGRNRRTVLNSVMLLVMGAIFWLAVIPSLSGYRMHARFSSTAADLDHRTGLWTQALDYMTPGLKSLVFGMGTGAFPLHYFYHHLDNPGKVHYSFHKTGGESYLAQGGGGYNLIQKVPLRPERDYLLRARLRTDQKSRVTFKFCPKHILFSERYTPQCVRKSFLSPGGDQWQVHEAVINSRHLGQAGLFYWPVTLQLHYGRAGSIAYITDIQILDSEGRNLIANGDFSAGADRWIMVRDFSHDDWHTKNIFMHYYFEQGLVGLVAFFTLLLAALGRQYRAVKSGDGFAPVLAAALVGVLTVGMFGSIIDNPRIAFLFYLLVYLGLLNHGDRWPAPPQPASKTDQNP